jgi:hypothetical protein
MGRHLVLVISDLAHVGDLGIVGLAQETLESRGIEQRVFPSVQCHHAKAQRLVGYGTPQLGERLGHQLKRARQRERTFGGAGRPRGRRFP